jgi:regulator of nucleoside diphosphate kinase
MANQSQPVPHFVDTRRSKKPLPPVAIAKRDLDRLTAVAHAAESSAPAFVAYLYRELERAKIIESDTALNDVICMGDFVTYRDEATHNEHKVQLVYPDEADLEAGRLSVLSSVGVALIGLRKNSSIEWFTRSGHARLLTVLEVSKDSTGGSLARSSSDMWIIRIYEAAKARGLSGHDSFVRCLKEVHRLEADQTEDQLRARIQAALNTHYGENPEAQ